MPSPQLNIKRKSLGQLPIQSRVSLPFGLDHVQELELRIAKVFKDRQRKEPYLLPARNLSFCMPIASYPMLYSWLQKDTAMDYTTTVSWWSKYHSSMNAVVEKSKRPSSITLDEFGVSQTLIFYCFMQIESFLTVSKLLKYPYYRKTDNQGNRDYIDYLQKVPYSKMEDVLADKIQQSVNEQAYITSLLAKLHKVKQTIDIDLLFYCLLHKTTWAPEYAQILFRQGNKITNMIDKEVKC